ncbi:MAG: hypothetical protein LAT67_04335 [Balneolales bacterium]|nr:hypothetical protein [Balneolales bacterium]
MLIFKSDNFMGSRYQIYRDEANAGQLLYNHWKGSAQVLTDAGEVAIKPKSLMSTDRIISLNDEIVGNAAFNLWKWKAEIRVTLNGSSFLMKAKDSWMRNYEVFFEREQGSIKAGEIKISGIFTYTYNTDFTDQVKPWFQAVLVSLIITKYSLMAVASG